MVVLSVSLQEATRYGLWRIHRYCDFVVHFISGLCFIANVLISRRTVIALEYIAQKKADTQLTDQNKQLMVLTHGVAHGTVQSVLFTIRYILHLPIHHGCKTPDCASGSFAKKMHVTQHACIHVVVKIILDTQEIMCVRPHQTASP